MEVAFRSPPRFTGHDVHAADPAASLYELSGHAPHSPAPAPLKVPAEQFEHVVESTNGENVPARHAKQDPAAMAAAADVTLYRYLARTSA